MEIAGIYKITSPSGKVYIGQSLNILNRWKAYKNYKAPKQQKLRASFLKYGLDAHDFHVLFECSNCINQEKITALEQYYIDYYRENGFELLNIREAGKNGKHSEATKEKFSQLRKGRTATAATKAKMAEISKLRYILLDDNEKAMIKARLNKTGFVHSDETKQKLKQSHSGKALPVQTKNKISESVKDWWVGKTHNSGENSKQSKLTESQVIEIRQKYKTGKYSTYSLAKEYNIHSSTTYNIITYKKWRHVSA